MMDTALTAVIGAGLGWIAASGWQAHKRNSARKHYAEGEAYAKECYDKGRVPDRAKICCPIFADGMSSGLAEIVQGNPDPAKLEAMGVDARIKSVRARIE